MLDSQEFPFWDLRIRDVIKHFFFHFFFFKKGEKVKHESSKAEKQMVDASLFKGNKAKKVFLLPVSSELLNALVVLLRK